jgi:FkbM family methyltransferase
MSPTAPRLIENGHIAVKRCRHGLFAYNVNDMYIGRSLDAYGEWSESELSLLFQVLKPGGVAIDVGANVGTHTVALAKHVTASGVVIAFEPQRLTFQLLCANVALNALVNVKCVNAAAGNISGHTLIPTLDPTVEQNIGALKSVGHEQGERTDLLRIDDLALTRCHLIKIDVEGFESQVLAGARATVRAHRPVLFVENNTEDGSPAILEALDALEYSCWWQIADYFNPRNFFGNEHRIFGAGHHEANVLCFPRESQVNAGNLWPVEGLDDTAFKAIARNRWSAYP